MDILNTVDSLLFNLHEILVRDSVIEIRKKPSIRAMLAECRRFMDYISEQKYRFIRSDLYVGLGELGGVFGQYIARLCTMYGINVEGDFGKILPIEDIESSEKES